MLYKLIVIAMLNTGQVIENTWYYPTLDSCIDGMQEFIKTSNVQGNYVVRCKPVPEEETGRD